MCAKRYNVGMPPVCPACSSAQTQAVKLMCLTATSDAETAGVALGGFGLAAGAAKTASMSRLAAKFAPLPESSPLRGMSFGLAAGLLGLLLVSQHPWAGAALLALGGILVFAAWGNNIAATRERARRFDMYERGWICLQCGASWIPKP